MPFSTSPSEPRRRRRQAAGALATLLACAAALLGSAGAERAAGGGERANVVVLMTDDQESSSLRVMKTVRKQIAAKGTSFKSLYANFPLCCPARATMMTGQYAHNHQVLSNAPPDGGFGVFDEKHAGNTLADWLQAAGYRTSYVGKYLNGYAEDGEDPTYIPPGWDDWHAFAPSRAEYFDYTLNHNGRLVDYGEEEDEYSTDVLTAKAQRFIRSSAADPEPFFLTLGYAAPHNGGSGSLGRQCDQAPRPATRHVGALKDDKRLERELPGFNEADVSDKPSSIRALEPLSRRQVKDIERTRRCAWESLLAVDESVGRILKTLGQEDVRDETYVFFVSDNGFLRGEHRIRDNKRLLYEESARVPFIVRGPGVARAATSRDVVVNADLVPTVLEIAGASAGEAQDGQSLLPRLASPREESGRAILLEAYAGQQITGVRTSRYLYAEWEVDGPQPEVELYDTYADPYQLDNVAADPAYAGTRQRLEAELDELIGCAGEACRTAPTMDLAVTPASSGDKGCVRGPLLASVTSPEAAEIAAVKLYLDGERVTTETVPPYEASLPVARKLRGERVELLARTELLDGRRLARATTLRICG